MTQKILFIDDDTGLQTLLKDYFDKKGLEMHSALTGSAGLQILEKEFPDIIILDLMLPETDGFETLRRIKKISDIPVIMLTALEDETDRIVGLEMGADDYLHKPINPRELLARIKAVLRRMERNEPAMEPAVASELVVDSDKNVVFIDGKNADLTSVEFDILKTLIDAKGRIVTREMLMDLARGRDFEAFDRSIDVHISRIRKKIETDPARPERIKTAWGKGYMWADGSDA